MANILVVEDNPVNARLVQSLLLQAGHTVEIAEHGARALEILHDRVFDLILMDLHMPVMDGFEAVTHLRRDPRHLVKPIIALTIDTSTEIRHKVCDAGFTDFIGKPYSRDELLERVRFHLTGEIE